MIVDHLAAQRAGAEVYLEARARRIAGRASYLTLFAAHEEFNAERTEDGEELPPVNFGLSLDDLVGASEETDTYVDDEATLDDTCVSADLEADAVEPAQADVDMATAAGAEEPMCTQPDAATT